MFDYFTEDGTKTDDCTEAKTRRRRGSSEPPLRLVWGSAPSADELYERLVALLSPVVADEDMTVLSREQLFADGQDHASADRPLVVRAANARENREAQIAAWLATPNPSLGGDRPDDLLRGDAQGRCRLGYVIAEMEQGAFS